MRVFLLCLFFSVSSAQIEFQAHDTDPNLNTLFEAANALVYINNQNVLQNADFSVHLTPDYVVFENNLNKEKWHLENANASSSMFDTNQRSFQIQGTEMLLPLAYASELREEVKRGAIGMIPVLGGLLDPRGFIYLINYYDAQGEVFQVKLAPDAPGQSLEMFGKVFVSTAGDLQCAGEIAYGFYVVETEGCNFNLIPSFFGLEP